jgi:hypothetical protein
MSLCQKTPRTTTTCSLSSFRYGRLIGEFSLVLEFKIFYIYADMVAHEAAEFRKPES